MFIVFVLYLHNNLSFRENKSYMSHDHSLIKIDVYCPCFCTLHVYFVIIGLKLSNFVAKLLVYFCLNTGD